MVGSASRPSRPDPSLAKVDQKIAEVTLDNPSDLVRCSLPNQGRRLKPSCRSCRKLNR
jgi:hypothetical protein